MSIYHLRPANLSDRRTSYDEEPLAGSGKCARDCRLLRRQVIRPGDTWKIFLRAEDPNGDMNDIAAVLWQAGVGTYPTEVTPLKGDDRREFSGYLFLSTPNDSNLMSDQMELTILVRDSQENRSHPIKLPLRFNLGARQEVPETWAEADKHRLGALMINIETSQRYSSR
jgi:hypothetical protein